MPGASIRSPGRYGRKTPLQRDVLTVVIQINGKLRGKIEVPASASKEEVEQLALTEQNIVRHLEGAHGPARLWSFPANSSTWWPTDEQTASGFGTCRGMDACTGLRRDC